MSTSKVYDARWDTEQVKQSLRDLKPTQDYRMVSVPDGMLYVDALGLLHPISGHTFAEVLHKFVRVAGSDGNVVVYVPLHSHWGRDFVRGNAHARCAAWIIQCVQAGGLAGLMRDYNFDELDRAAKALGYVPS